MNRELTFNSDVESNGSTRVPILSKKCVHSTHCFLHPAQTEFITAHSTRENKYVLYRFTKAIRPGVVLHASSPKGISFLKYVMCN